MLTFPPVNTPSMVNTPTRVNSLLVSRPLSGSRALSFPGLKDYPTGQIVLVNGLSFALQLG